MHYNELHYIWLALCIDLH